MAGSLRDVGPAELGLLDQRPEILLIRLVGRFSCVLIASGTLSASGNFVVCAGINPRRGPASASALTLMSPAAVTSASVSAVTDGASSGLATTIPSSWRSLASCVLDSGSASDLALAMASSIVRLTAVYPVSLC